MTRLLTFFLLALATALPLSAQPLKQISGIYPHLASFNDERECGTGAVVPFADRLWIITYGPHLPFGSSDKLYEITPDLDLIVRPESVGGTPANRLIHTESNQLAIGPYLIDADRNVRTLQPKHMPGRLTGTARHLTDPANKLYFATMEEGLYEVDVHTLAITGLIADGNKPKPGQTEEKSPATLNSKLPGYHGKGLYTGQGKLIYANNGEQDKRIATDPTIPSGALAEWTTPGQDWKLIRRNQFTEVTGPGGILGNPNPDTDPIWSTGWDYRSLILMCLHEGKWTAYRLPKGSHSYDGSHGWNTEWPRIREIGQGNPFLMTMHGTFWHFPKTFTPATSAGITPLSNYLKVIGDFAKWNDHIVFGCDDTAASEFLNTRKAKGHTVPAGQSQSNLWFVKPDQLTQFGPLIGRGAVWQNDTIQAATPSDPYLFSGYDHRLLHLTHQSDTPVTFTLEIDKDGNNQWTSLRTFEVPAKGYTHTFFTPEETGTWIRLTPSADAKNVTALFQYHNNDTRPTEPSDIFTGIANPTTPNPTGGLLHVRGGNHRTLRLLQQNPDSKLTLHDLDHTLTFKAVEDPAAIAWQTKNVAIPENVITIEDSSVLYIDDQNRRWRLPKNDPAFDQPGPLGPERLCREVATERDLLNVHGTFYELPAENAGGFSKMRPISTHNLRIKDYATYRGLLFLSGIDPDASPTDNPHILRNAETNTALWVGAVDDLWKAGKPRGQGGPWLNTNLKANDPSDPYLMTGYDKKTLTLSHQSATPITIDVQVDLTGSGDWVTYKTIEVPSGETKTHEFPAAFTAYWVRTISNNDTTATAQLTYK
ncbi:hypothetical protein FEM03_22955 [Phragmitibacter flavus]|uniref:Uncharacterized protein n=1 Tax=Phragmitibacter flavus TaxID=2576071 RepID=A0A5R8K7Q1_9BACT|nr:hypothetical protein [Phragmitibacter flavus]TLD68366.1 hypothetical protein FEM03_22955 [Phragmitibacter flavus]